MRIQPWTEKQLMSREETFEALVSKALRRTMRVVTAEVREKALTAAVSAPAPSPETVSYTALESAVLATWTGFVDSELFPFLTDTFMESSEKVADGLAEAGLTIADTLTNVYAQEFLQYAYNRMVGVGEDLWRNIRTELEEGFAAGEGIREVAARLTEVAGLTEPRAKMVARTEMISAANAGSYLQMVAAGFDNSEASKVWLATEDDRTRESHRHADNQEVPLLDEFSVDIYSGAVKTGTESMEFPGDPVATPGNVINCRCSLAFEFSDDEDDVMTAAAKKFIEAQHPRDNDGKFKEKGAPNTFYPDDDTAIKSVKSIAGSINQLKDAQAATFVQKLTKKHWDAFDADEKKKVSERFGTLKGEHIDAAKAALAKLQAPAAKKGRPLGGKDVKTGKALSPGKPVKLKVQFLYNTAFEDGAVMAVRKDSDERLVWNGKKIERQKKGADGKYVTTETKTRGDAYKAWNDEDGWTIPEAADEAPASAPEVPAVTGGKSIYLRVQVIYNTKYDDGDVVAVNPSTGETITWDAKKKRMVVTSGILPPAEYTRGALYKQFKDEEGWFTPGDATAAPAVADEPDDVVDTDIPFTPVTKIGGESNDKMKEALANPFVPAGTTLFESTFEGETTTIKKVADGKAEITHNGGAPVVMLEDDIQGTLSVVSKINEAKVASKKPAIVVKEMQEGAPDAPAPAPKAKKTKGAPAELDPATGKWTKPVLFSVTYNGKTYTRLSKNNYTHVSVVHVPPNFVGGEKDIVWSWHLSESNALKGSLTGSQKQGGAYVKEVIPVQLAGADAPAKPKIEVKEAKEVFPSYGYFDQASYDDLISTKNAEGTKLGATLYTDPEVTVVKAMNGVVVLDNGSPQMEIVKDKDLTPLTLSDAVAQVSAGSLADDTPTVPSVLGTMPNVADLTFTGQTVGTHHGKIFRDKDGNTWLFKAAPAGFKAAAAVDLATALMHDAAGLPTPETGIVTIDGQTGSLQKIIPNVSEPFDYAMSGPLTPNEVFQIQVEHAFDWMVGNHDAHAKNLLQNSNGNLIGIDKGQAFKWLGYDKLDWNFQPNEHPQAALQLYKQYAQGKNVAIKDPSTGTLAKAIKDIQAIPDDTYRAMLRPYAEQAAKDGKLGLGGPKYLGLNADAPFDPNDVEGFLDAAVARKNNLMTDLKKLYDKAAKSRAFALEDDAPPPPPTPDPALLQAVTPKGVPLKMSYSLLVNPKTTQYPHGKVIAENPEQGERLVWNGPSKKYVVQTKGSMGQWVNAHQYTKQGAYKNLKDDAGWVTPTSDLDQSGASTPVPTVQGGAPAPNIVMPSGKNPLAPKTPKFSVADLQAQADSTANLNEFDRKSIYLSFRTKGGKAGLGNSVKTTSSGSDMFEAMLEAQAAHNQGSPGNRVTLLQVLRAVDEQASANASKPNENLFEKKVIAWLGTPAGKKAAQNVHTSFKLSPEAKKELELAKSLSKFQTKADNKAQGTPAYLKVDAVPLSKPKAHVEGDQYPFVSSASAGSAIGKKMAAAHGDLTPQQYQAARAYTGSSYMAMNSFMRSFGTQNTDKAASSLHVQQGMKPLPQSMSLYRNVSTVFDDKWKPSVAELQGLIGKKFYEDAFASTSIDGKFGSSHPYRFIIEVPEGTPAIWVEDFSMNSGEKEFLLAAGLKYEVLDAEAIGTGYSEKIVIRLRVVP